MQEGLRYDLISNTRHGSERFVQEQLGRPIWDSIYKTLWSNGISIERDLGKLKEIFGIDVAVRRPGYPMVFYGQEKTLGYYHGQRYDTLTIEHMRNFADGTPGTVSRINTGFYACAYLNQLEDDFAHGCIVLWSSIIVATWNNKIKWQHNRNKDGIAKSSFIYTEINGIPADCFLWRKHPVQL